jgi:uncharacterized protein
MTPTPARRAPVSAWQKEPHGGRRKLARDRYRIGRHTNGHRRLFPVPHPVPCSNRAVTQNRAILDPYVIEFDDLDAAGELRFNAIGLVDGRMLFVTYTLRDDVVRIISALGAEPHEKRKYHEI